MNEHSSRSHAIFTLILEQRIEGCSVGGESAEPNVGSSVRFLTAKFHLVDLAGGFCRALLCEILNAGATEMSKVVLEGDEAVMESWDVL